MHRLAPTPSTTDPAPLASARASELLDAHAAMELMGNSTALYLEIAHAYLQQIALLPQQLDDLLQQADLGAARRTLHSCKGLSLTVGARHLSEVCRQYETTLRALHPTGMPPDTHTHSALKAELDQTVQQTRLALSSVIERLEVETCTR